MLEIKLCIFDVDGVLVNSRLLHYPATAKALADYGYEYSQEEDDEFGTIPTLTKLEQLAKSGKIHNDDIDSIWKLKDTYSCILFDENIMANGQIKSLFKKLKDSNIGIVLASNARYSFVKKVVSLLGVSEYVDHILSAQYLTPKPDPEIYLTAMKLMGVSPSDTIIFEDSEVGKAAAYASGASVYEVESYDELNSSIFYTNETYSTSR
jgi:HAD superfamily hydrolase (TIGR01509 family)